MGSHHVVGRRNGVAMAAVTFDVSADAPLRGKPSRGNSSRGRNANLNAVYRETARELRP